MASDLAATHRDCSECGRPLLLVAEISEFDRQGIGIFKCTDCARIYVIKDYSLEQSFDPVGDGAPIEPADRAMR